MAADAIIVGGGSGIRFGQKKQFLTLGGIPVLRRAVLPFENHPDIGKIIVVVPETDMEQARAVLSDVGKPYLLARGGRMRQESVWNGLGLALNSERVLIHDAVRPFATMELVTRLLEGIDGYDACIPGVAVANTLKEVDGGLVVRTIPRSSIYGVQTPQCFITGKLLDAHRFALERGITDATDDSALVEEMGGRVRLIEGDPANIKITVRQDLAVAEAMLRCRTGLE